MYGSVHSREKGVMAREGVLEQIHASKKKEDSLRPRDL